MLVKFQTSDNILGWDSSLFQNTDKSEIFCYVKKEKGRKLNYIESELEAIERIKILKQLHQEFGIKKSPRFYEYAKITMMEEHDKGYTVTDEHFFKDWEGEKIIISFN